jgi:hypothetical protein
VLDKSFLLQEFLQTAIFMHLLHDVATTDKLLLDVDLRNGGPIRVLLDRRSNQVVRQHIHVLEFLPVCVHQHDDEATEAALGLLLRALHEDHDVVLIDPLCESLLELV